MSWKTSMTILQQLQWVGSSSCSELRQRCTVAIWAGWIIGIVMIWCLTRKTNVSWIQSSMRTSPHQHISWVISICMAMPCGQAIGEWVRHSFRLLMLFCYTSLFSQSTILLSSQVSKQDTSSQANGEATCQKTLWSNSAVGLKANTYQMKAREIRVRRKSARSPEDSDTTKILHQDINTTTKT